MKSQNVNVGLYWHTCFFHSCSASKLSDCKKVSFWSIWRAKKDNYLLGMSGMSEVCNLQKKSDVPEEATSTSVKAVVQPESSTKTYPVVSHL